MQAKFAAVTWCQKPEYSRQANATSNLDIACPSLEEVAVVVPGGVLGELDH